MAFYRVRLDVIVEAPDWRSASDDVRQLVDTIPEPDPPILSIYQAREVDQVHRGDGADQWIVVTQEDEPAA